MEQQNQEQQLTKQQLAEFNKQQRAVAQRRKEEKDTCTQR